MKTQLITKRKVQQNIMQYAIMMLLILVVGGYFGYKNYAEYQATLTAFENETNQLAQLKAEAEKSSSEYLALKKDFEAQNSSVNQSIDKILPPREDFTTLARDLDKYFINTNSSGLEGTLFLSDLRFNPARLDSKSEFGVLPLSMSIVGGELGFKDFLKYIEQTGDLNGQSRLLDISNMNFSFSNNQNTNTTTEPAKSVNASVNLNAYFQQPALDDNTDKL